MKCIVGKVECWVWQWATHGHQKGKRVCLSKKSGVAKQIYHFHVQSERASERERQRVCCSLWWLINDFKFFSVSFPIRQLAHARINGIASLGLNLSSYSRAQNEFEFVVCSLLFERQSKVNHIAVFMRRCVRCALCAGSKTILCALLSVNIYGWMLSGASTRCVFHRKAQDIS